MERVELDKNLFNDIIESFNGTILSEFFKKGANVITIIDNIYSKCIDDEQVIKIKNKVESICKEKFKCEIFEYDITFNENRNICYIRHQLYNKVSLNECCALFREVSQTPTTDDSPESYISFCCGDKTKQQLEIENLELAKKVISTFGQTPNNKDMFKNKIIKTLPFEMQVGIETMILMANLIYGKHNN